MTQNDIDQILIKINFEGDVSGTLPIFNYNYNILNKSVNKGGYIYIPNKILLNYNLFKIKNLKDKEIINKLRNVFISEEAINKLYKEKSDKIKDKSDNIIKNNLKFIIDLFFIKNENFYLNNEKFKINDIKNNITDKFSIKKFKKNQELSSKLCSLEKNLNTCNINNLENRVIENYKINEIKFIKKIDPSLSVSEKNKKAYKEAIEKYRKGNQDEQIKNYANEVIEKHAKKNELKRAGLKYIFDSKLGIVLDSNKNIIDNIIINLNLIHEKNIIATKKIHIEHGNCKTKKNKIKSLWKKLIDKNVYTKTNKIQKWVYIKTSEGYELKSS